MDKFSTHKLITNYPTELWECILDESERQTKVKGRRVAYSEIIREILEDHFFEDSKEVTKP